MAVQSAVQLPATVTPVTTAETVVLILPFSGQGTARGPVLIQGFVNYTQGTSGTAVTIRVRTGTTTAGTLIGVADVHTLAAAALAQIPFAALDQSQFPAGNQYCVTVQATAASANPSVTDGVAFLDVISPSQ